MKGVDGQYNNQPQNPKKGVILALFFLALFAVVLGIVRVRKNLHPNIPWAKPFQNTARSSDTKNVASLFTDILAEQNKDTDEDGLSDYDELNRYKTSPYLKDTDSDGFDDKTELDSKNDPSCPRGKTCTAATAVPEVAPSTLLTPSVAPGIPASVPPFSPEQARALLRQGGLTDEQIATFDDATLEEMYNEAIQKAKPSASRSTSLTYTPAQIRELLKGNGISEELLQGVDDATLLKIFNEAIQEQQQTP